MVLQPNDYFMLRCLQLGLSYKQIGYALHRTPNQVWYRLNKWRKFLGVQICYDILPALFERAEA